MARSRIAASDGRCATARPATTTSASSGAPKPGDHAAFRALFDRYHRRVFAVALGVVKNPQDALDVVQEAFVKVHKHLGDLPGRVELLHLAVPDHHEPRDRPAPAQEDRRARSTSTTRVGRDDEVDDAGNLRPHSTARIPARPTRARSWPSKIQAALATLPEYHRQVILLREVEGLSYEEIAKIMKVPKGTIMSRLFHARRKMQSALADYVDGELTPQDEQNDDGDRSSMTIRCSASTTATSRRSRSAVVRARIEQRSASAARLRELERA